MTRQRLAAVGLLAWAATGVVVGGALMRGHWVPLPVPPADGSVSADRAPGRWTALHVLQADCGCSRRVFDRLRDRPPLDGVGERIVWVADAEDMPDAIPTGYEFERLGGPELVRRYGVEAAPVLVVLDPRGVARYRGGYTDRKRGYEVRDREVIRACLSGAPPPPLPVYGCPVSDRLKTATSLLPPRARQEPR